MSLLPTLVERLARARADLRMGVAVVLCDGDRALLVLAAETMDEKRLDAVRDLGAGMTLALTARRAETLKARVYDGDLARVQVPRDASLGWIRALADPADDLIHPMKGPLMCQRDGPADLHRLALSLAKQAQILPAVLTCPLENGATFAAQHDLSRLDASVTAPLLAETSPMAEVIHARLPMTVSEAGQLHIFRPEDGGVEHYAVEIGRPDRSKPVLTRLHSACFTGDVLGSLKCDCGPQLHSALTQMGSEGAGILLYLNQEGRGIGLANKMRPIAFRIRGSIRSRPTTG